VHFQPLAASAVSPTRLKRVFGVLVWLGVIACAVSSLLPYADAVHWTADVFAHFRAQYLVALALLAPAAFLLRMPRAGFVAVAGVAVNLWEMLPHTEGNPITTEIPSQAVRVRCVTSNVLQGNHDPAALESFLRACGADVVVLQEMTPEIAQVLARVSKEYPHQFIRGRRDSKGTAIIARLPMSEQKFEPAPNETAVGLVRARLETPAGAFTILGIHSHKPTSARGTASQHIYFPWLAERCHDLQSRGIPVVLAGDFNSTPWSARFRDFARRAPMLDTSRGSLFAATWSHPLPYRLLIDHCFVSPEWKVAAREIGPYVGSDHRPLIVDLALAPK
jgi:endonuclease/exonuclease/phosphatase (EEP) superfamily protein YafD